MKRLILVVFVTIIAFQSCKENDNPDPEPQNSVLEYFPLAIGNYWVYERSSCDSTWTDCNLISIDTNRITKDTLINELLYYKMEGKNILGNNIPVYLRDSNNFIVNSIGQILLTTQVFDSILYEKYVMDINQNDTIFYLFNQMIDHPNNVVVQAGTFNCIDNRTTLFKVQEGINEGINAHSYYAKGVGLVYHNSIFAGSLGGLKRELLYSEYLVR